MRPHIPGLCALGVIALLQLACAAPSPTGPAPAPLTVPGTLTPLAADHRGAALGALTVTAEATNPLGIPLTNLKIVIRDNPTTRAVVEVLLDGELGPGAPLQVSVTLPGGVGLEGLSCSLLATPAS